MASDYGPVPASQVKSESNRIFAALEQGRRVLISRYGKVVAVIDPPTIPDDLRMLAAYAVPSSEAPPELTATEIAQGSPAEYIRLAEEGQATLVTRNSKVYGVLLPPSEQPAPSDPDEQERMLARFEQEHPDASPAEFAAEVARVTSDDTVQELITQVAAPSRSAITPSVDDELDDTRMWSDAAMIEGVALEQIGEIGPAKSKFRQLIEQLHDEDDPYVRRRVRGAQVELARLSVADGDPTTALTVAADVQKDIETASAQRTKATGVSHGATVAARLGLLGTFASRRSGAQA